MTARDGGVEAENVARVRESSQSAEGASTANGARARLGLGAAKAWLAGKASRAKIAVRAKTKAVVRRVKLELREQFPPPDVWFEHMERLEEVAAFEAAERERATAVVESSSDGVGAATSTPEDVGEPEASVASVAGSEDVIDASADVEELNLDFERCALSPCEASTSYDENDYVFDEEDGDDHGTDEHRVVVVPRALGLDGALPQSNTVSFVPPPKALKLTGKVIDSSKANTFWAGARSRTGFDFSRDAPVVRVTPSSPASPECPIPSPPHAEKTAHAETPPWYLKRLDRESRELAKTARTLIDWTTDLFDVSAPDADAPTTESHLDADVTVNSKTKMENVWINVGECDLVIAVPSSNCEKCE